MTTWIPIKKGTTNVSIDINIIDSTTGIPETEVGDTTAGLSLWYRIQGGDSYVAIPPEPLASLGDSHQDGGINTIANGVYRFDLPDAACGDSLADEVTIGGTATGMIVIPTVIPLVSYDPYDSVRMGLAALPNGTAGDSLGLPIKDDLALSSEITTDVLAGIVEGSYTLADIMRLLAAFAFANTEDGGLSFRNLANSKDRFTVTIDGNNRTITIVDAT